MTQFNTDFAFTSGYLTTVLDGGAGSSGKGKIASFIAEHSNNWQFCCQAFMSNAAHTVVLDDGKAYLYQSLNSCSYLNKYQKSYVCGGAVLELQPLLREIKENDLDPSRLGIHPLVAMVQQKDVDYERGLVDFDGKPVQGADHSSNMKIGSTLHGVGAARARRILRRSDVLLARDIPELAPYLCQTDEEIIKRLKEGQAGILEVAQGYQLSYLSEFYPKCTSRNCSVAAGLDDCCIPPKYAGNVIVNFRTYPIRVNSNKFKHLETGKILTALDMAAMKAEGQEHLIQVIKGDSGGCYADQREITWDQVTAASGIKEIDRNREIREITSLTKLERRVYTFSGINYLKAIEGNLANGRVYTSINFMNYVDASVEGVRGTAEQLTDKVNTWIEENVPSHGLADLKFLGTGPKTNDMILL